jgi:hypothetical protein
MKIKRRSDRPGRGRASRPPDAAAALPLARAPGLRGAFARHVRRGRRPEGAPPARARRGLDASRRRERTPAAASRGAQCRAQAGPGKQRAARTRAREAWSSARPAIRGRTPAARPAAPPGPARCQVHAPGHGHGRGALTLPGRHFYNRSRHLQPPLPARRTSAAAGRGRCRPATGGPGSVVTPAQAPRSRSCLGRLACRSS